VAENPPGLFLNPHKGMPGPHHGAASGSVDPGRLLAQGSFPVPQGPGKRPQGPSGPGEKTKSSRLRGWLPWTSLEEVCERKHKRRFWGKPLDTCKNARKMSRL
jgi:hypothetical protein